MTVEEKIWAALVAHIDDLDLAGDPPLAWPNRKSDPGKPYIRVDHFRNRNERVHIKGSAPHLRQGILMLTVVAPLHAGTRDALALAGVIAEHFPADLELDNDGVRVRVQAAPDVGSGIKQDASWDVPVSIRYECWA